MNVTVDVISDVICPWCFIGKRRLEKAIAAYGRAVKVAVDLKADNVETDVVRLMWEFFQKHSMK